MPGGWRLAGSDTDGDQMTGCRLRAWDGVGLWERIPFVGGMTMGSRAHKYLYDYCTLVDHSRDRAFA